MDLVRAFIVLLALLFASPAVRAEPVRLSLPPHCTLATGPDVTAAQALVMADQFNCSDPLSYTPGKVNWALISDLAIAPVKADPWTFLHSLGRERGEQVWFAYADGKFLPSPTSAMAARQTFSTADVAFALPDHDAALSAILVRVENSHAIRGLVPRPALETQSARAETSSWFHMFFGFFGGLIGAMLIFNFTLFLVMRHRFQLYYCLFAAAITSFAFCWSGGIFLLFPEMTTFEQVRANNFTIALCLLTAPLFYLSFIEPGVVPRWMRRLILSIAVVPLAVTTARLGLPDGWWRALDMVFYGALLAGIAMLVISSIIALRRGSRVVRFVMLSWSLPYFLITLRGLWGMNIITFSSGLFDLSPFIAIAFEAIVSAVGMGWRIRELRRERDQARGREDALTILAETDPLTNLLNRRAFIERAQQGDTPKTLIILDIDRFKAINDAFGHEVGDRVLERVSATIISHVPDGGIAGRIGGEEFAVIVPGTDGAELAEYIRGAIMTITLPQDIVVTASAGTAIGPVCDETSWRALYIAADQALYSAKRGGRNQVHQSAMAVAA